MIKIVIWIDLNAQGVCTYQLWHFLILWCSTCLEDSRDYKFVIFGLTELKIWIKQANGRFDSVVKIDWNWTHKIRIIIVLLDSRCSKDSNGISFVIFGPTDQKIWFSENLDKIWFQISIRICFKSPADTWRVLIGAYRFGWIGNKERWILRGLDAWDHLITLHLSDSIWTTRSRSDGQRQRRGALTGLG
jgi:hypothetical protein